AIQKGMLPRPMPDIPGVRLAASYETFDRAGGDYYDLIPLGSQASGVQHDPYGPWGVLIADASGHGPSAAVRVAVIHALLRGAEMRKGGPIDVLGYLNRPLATRAVNGSFVTAFYGVYEPRTRELTYARAGHNPPIIKNPGSGGSVRWLEDAGGMP